MNGWSSHAGADRWDDEPAWIYEITWEWEPLPGQRYPGDAGRRRAVHTPVYEASRGPEGHGVGRATVGPPPTSPPSWSDPRGQQYGHREAGATDGPPPGPSHGQQRHDGPPPQTRVEPSWNRPVPVPERLPGSWADRPAPGRVDDDPSQTAARRPSPGADAPATDPRFPAPDLPGRPTDAPGQRPSAPRWADYLATTGDRGSQGAADTTSGSRPDAPGYPPGPAQRPRSVDARPAQQGDRSAATSAYSGPPTTQQAAVLSQPGQPATEPVQQRPGSRPPASRSGSDRLPDAPLPYQGRTPTPRRPDVRPGSPAPVPPYESSRPIPVYPREHGRSGSQNPVSPHRGPQAPQGSFAPRQRPRTMPSAPVSSHDGRYSASDNPRSTPASQSHHLAPPAPTSPQHSGYPTPQSPRPVSQPPPRPQSPASAAPVSPYQNARPAPPNPQTVSQGPAPEFRIMPSSQGTPAPFYGPQDAPQPHRDPRATPVGGENETTRPINAQPPRPEAQPPRPEAQPPRPDAQPPAADSYRPRRLLPEDDPYAFTWAPPREVPTAAEYLAQPQSEAPQSQPVSPTPPAPRDTPRAPAGTPLAGAPAADDGPTREDLVVPRVPVQESTDLGRWHDSDLPAPPGWFEAPLPTSAPPSHHETESDLTGERPVAFAPPGAASWDEPGYPGDNVWMVEPAEIVGEIVTGEIVTGEISTGEIIRAEVIIAGPPMTDFGAATAAEPAIRVDEADEVFADLWPDQDRFAGPSPGDAGHIVTGGREPAEPVTDSTLDVEEADAENGQPDAGAINAEPKADAEDASRLTPETASIDGQITDPASADEPAAQTATIDESKPQTHAPTPETTAESDDGDGGQHGLGWLLEISGLGGEPEWMSPGDDDTPADPPVEAATAPVEAATAPPVSEPETTPVSETPATETPATETLATETLADEKPDWFAPATDPRMAIPDHVLAAQAAATSADEPAHDTAPETADDTPAIDVNAAEATPAESPTEDAPGGGEGGAAAPAGQLAPTPARQPDRPGAERQRRLVDPETVLSTYRRRFDPETLREFVDEPDQLWSVRDRLTDKVEYVERDAVRARLLSLRAVVSRLLGDLDLALTDGREALGHAESTGELRRISIARARLAHVLQWRGEFAEADRLYAEADSVELPDRLRAEMRELAGRSAFDQGRYLEAFNSFEEALDLRKGEDPEMVGRIELALDAVLSRVGDKGWGPYPRTKQETLQKHRTPKPAYDERSGLWGYPGAVLPLFVDAQPFQEGVAWVRRPNVPMWELIDERGGVLIDASAGYLGATAFAEGLAWVARDGVGGWFAIDTRNRVIIPGGFEDVRPFRRGVAPIRRGGWGAIDRHGRLVVQTKYRAFATALTGGRRVDGFTEEGLAVIDAGDRYGLIDRTGHLIVPPVHAALVIHPVAVLIADRNGHWGALDRTGEPLIDFLHASEKYVTEAIERLLVDTRPVL